MTPRARPFKESFVRFAGVGIIGFLIDASVLTGLVLVAGWSTLPARLVSMSLAITGTWLINRRFTFTGSTVPPRVEYAGYVAIQLVGVCINFAVFVACLKVWPHLARWPVVPLAVGAATSLSFNFVAARNTLYSARGAP